MLAAIAVFAGVVLPRCWQSVNTDFPNYYVAARLVREGYPTDRLYEWDWFARQKDRMQVDQPLAGFIPHTPFCALVLLPIANLQPLTAKRVWIATNLAMLLALAGLFAQISRISWRWWTIGSLFYVPTIRNLEYGQLYILILLLLTGALCLYLHRWNAWSGFLVGVAAALKIFPAVFILYFVRKRDLRALAGFLAGVAVPLIACLFVFRPHLLLTFATQVLPAALRGEANDPYNLTAASMSSLLHHLFVFEPQWNPHPLAHMPVLLAVLQPILQWLVLGSTALVISQDKDPRRVSLEWGVLVVASLAASTMPASYHFVLLLLPVAIWTQRFASKQQIWPVAAYISLVLLVGWPKWPAASGNGWTALLAVPRLWFLLLLFVLGLRHLALINSRPVAGRKVWIAGIAVLAALQIVLGIQHARSVYGHPEPALVSSKSIFAIATPSFHGQDIGFSAMTLSGWHVGRLRSQGSLRLENSNFDELAEAADDHNRFVERDATSSAIWLHSTDHQPALMIHDAQNPTLSPDGEELGFLRPVKGRGSLWVRVLASGSEKQLTGEDLDVYEASFSYDHAMIFSAAKAGVPSLYRVDGEKITPLGISEARYPSVSPDRRWLAYSKLTDSHWHLVVRDLATNTERSVQSAACNQSWPAWSGDSRSLVFTSDCGRGLWETSLVVKKLAP